VDPQQRAATMPAAAGAVVTGIVVPSQVDLP
jgi:hypothetical protein